MHAELGSRALTLMTKLIKIASKEFQTFSHSFEPQNLGQVILRSKFVANRN